MSRRPLLALATTAALAASLAACSSDPADDAGAAVAPAASSPTNQPTENPDMQLVRVPAPAAADLLATPPADLVVLDVRTPEEFAEGHLDGAELLDFYRADFGDRLAELDRGVPYLLYCRSGNRSGQTLEMMRQLGFTDVTEIEGGVISWSQEGLPLVSG
jgi:rhodanese-related sulfurtransferase